MLTTLLAGFGLGLSLIVAIGAQNAFVLRQGLRAEYVGPVVLACTLSDALLIAVGVGGIGLTISRSSWLLDAIRVGGAAFLFGYAVVAARRALKPGVLTPDEAHGTNTLAAVLSVCLALTWLNPHVYLDTVLLVGSVAQGSAAPWWFASGAMLASGVWFSALGFGARYVRPVFARPIAWQVLDGVIALVMVTIGISLIIGVHRT